MSLVPVKTPLLVKKMFPNYLWGIPTDDRVVYLTFDDGPVPGITEWVLKTLETYQAKATFFCVGSNAATYPDIFRQIIQQGHTIGNHTYEHLNGLKTVTNTYLENVIKADTVINPYLPSNTRKLFRPPYGQIKLSQARQLIKMNYQIIMWDVISFDWDKKTSREKCLEHVIGNAVNGSIIVFHDSLKASKNMMYALPKALDHFSNSGYTFKEIAPTGIV